ncbi:methyltransferase domain-containing protein [Candidatus Roizmanbacteria bacterium]|nr:methyltransferase domain-containing protein [Candidatus Roizmanbacteria bacterium]
MNKNHNNDYYTYKAPVSTHIFTGQIKTKGTSGVERLIEQLKKYYRSSDNVLEIACGSGRATFRAIDFMNKIIAIDISKDRINEAGNILKNMKSKKARFEVMDTRKLKFQNNSFSLIFTLLPSVDLDEYFSEVKRVLEPKGLFIITHSGSHQMAEAGRFRRMYYLQKTLRLVKKNDFSVLTYFDDIQKLWFNTEKDRWNIVTIPYWNHPKLGEMKKLIKKFKDEIGYPLTLDKVTLVLRKEG